MAPSLYSHQFQQNLGLYYHCFYSFLIESVISRPTKVKGCVLFITALPTRGRIKQWHSSSLRFKEREVAVLTYRPGTPSQFSHLISGGRGHGSANPLTAN